MPKNISGDNIVKQPTRKRIKSIFFDSFAAVLLMELFEEALEEAFAWGITAIISKAVSTVIIVFATQLTKFGVKKVAKIITTALKPVIKKLTYKKGNDKMKKIKSIFNKLKEVVKNNPVTISGSAINTVVYGSGAYALIEHILQINIVPVWAAYVIGVAITVALFALTEFSIVYFGAENSNGVTLRKLTKSILTLVGADKLVENLDAIEATAIEEKEKAAALAAEQAEIEAEKARVLAEQEEREAEIRAQIEAERAKIEQEKKEAEDAARKEAIRKLALEAIEREKAQTNQP